MFLAGFNCGHCRQRKPLWSGARLAKALWITEDSHDQANGNKFHFSVIETSAPYFSIKLCSSLLRLGTGNA